MRNFAEPVQLGPLEGIDARQLAETPLKNMGIRFESTGLADDFLYPTGCRPNLIALACNSALNRMGALSGRVITRELLNAVLDVGDESGRDIARSFAIVQNLTSDTQGSRLDQMVLYAGVLAIDQEGHIQRDAVRRELERFGVKVLPEKLRETLERLTLAYALAKKSGSFNIPAPCSKTIYSILQIVIPQGCWRRRPNVGKYNKENSPVGPVGNGEYSNSTFNTVGGVLSAGAESRLSGPNGDRGLEHFKNRPLEMASYIKRILFPEAEYPLNWGTFSLIFRAITLGTIHPNKKLFLPTATLGNTKSTEFFLIFLL